MGSFGCEGRGSKIRFGSLLAAVTDMAEGGDAAAGVAADDSARTIRLECCCDTRLDSPRKTRAVSEAVFPAEGVAERRENLTQAEEECHAGAPGMSGPSERLPHSRQLQLMSAVAKVTLIYYPQIHPRRSGIEIETNPSYSL